VYSRREIEIYRDREIERDKGRFLIFGGGVDDRCQLELVRLCEWGFSPGCGDFGYFGKINK